MTPIKTEMSKNLVKTLYRFINDYGANVIYHKHTGYCEVVPLKYITTDETVIADIVDVKLKDLTPEEMTEVLHFIEKIPSED